MITCQLTGGDFHIRVEQEQALHLTSPRATVQSNLGSVWDSGVPAGITVGHHLLLTDWSDSFPASPGSLSASQSTQLRPKILLISDFLSAAHFPLSRPTQTAEPLAVSRIPAAGLCATVFGQ